MQSDRRRLLDKLLRELVRAEAQAIEHAPREARRIGDVPPVAALRDVATHAVEMRPRFHQLLDGHNLTPRSTASRRRCRRCATSSPIASPIPSALIAEHCSIFVTASTSCASCVMSRRLEELFALIRWCDDYLAARRTLVARVEAQLAWFAEQPSLPPAPEPGESEGEPAAPPWHVT